MNPVDTVIAKLRLVVGIIDVWPVPSSEKPAILRQEEDACASGGFVGLQLVNEGAKLAMNRECVVAINHSPSLRHPSKPLLILTLDDAIVGQEVWEEEQIARFERDSNAILLGDGLVLFRDKLGPTRRKTLRLVLGPQDFPEIETVHGICDIVSATVSRTTDIHIKLRAGWDTTPPETGTVLIGFNSRSSEEVEHDPTTRRSRNRIRPAN